MQQPRVQWYWHLAAVGSSNLPEFRGGILLRKNGLEKEKMEVEGLAECNKNTQRKALGAYSKGRRNSNPNRRVSPRFSWRNTLAIIGGVSLGTKLEEAGDGAGIVRCTI